MSAPQDTALKAGETVTVTGANGYLASHLIEALLSDGYSVRGTVRDPGNEAKTAHLHALAERLGASERLTLVRGDLLEPGSMDEAMRGAHAVCHCAAAVAFVASDPQRDLVDPSVVGTQNVLASVERGGSARRVVHTSSIAAVLSDDKPHGHRFTEADWNRTSTLRVDPYGLAKVEAERAARAFVDAMPEGARIRLVHLHPGMVWGPPMIKAHAKASPKLLRDIVSRANPGVPRLMFGTVDVRDVARAHIAALTHPDPPDRCLLVGDNVWLDDVAAQLQALFPEIQMGTRRLPKWLVLAAAMRDPNLNARQLRKLIGRAMPLDNQRSLTAYGLTYRPLRHTLRETVEVMVEEGWARTTTR